MSLTSVCYCYMTTDVRDEMHALSMFPRVMQPKVFVNGTDSAYVCCDILNRVAGSSAWDDIEASESYSLAHVMSFNDAH